MGRTGPLVTAVVPAYRSAAFIQRTLDSLAAQTWENLEILVGDDASPDGTADVFRAFGARHANVRLVLRTRNLGWIGNTNDLMAQARGEFLFFMPHDDWIEPTYVERLTKALLDTPGASLALSDIDFSRNGEAPGVLSFDALSGLDDAFERAMVMARVPKDAWIAHRAIFRAEHFRKLGGLRTAPIIGHFSADMTWIYQMALEGPFVRVPEVLYHKLWMPQSLSRGWKGSFLTSAGLMLAAVGATLRSRLGVAEKARIVAGLAGVSAARAARGARRRAGRQLGLAAR
jgi:glycosyltransferase involved in cell wall biosynthesis